MAGLLDPGLLPCMPLPGPKPTEGKRGKRGVQRCLTLLHAFSPLPIGQSILKKYQGVQIRKEIPSRSPDPRARGKPCGTRPDEEGVFPGWRKEKPQPSSDPRV
jgi:hypothetical protein